MLKVVTNKPYHNHLPDQNMQGHSIARRMSTEQSDLVHNAIKTGSTPRAAAALVGEIDSTFCASSQDIQNMKNKKKKEFLAGRSMIDAFFTSLDCSGHIYNVNLGANNEIVNLFIANPVSVVLAQNYNKVLLMDCMYKTNKYKMPLLNIVGLSSFNKTFFVGFCFMKEELEPDYQWALERVKNIYTGVELPGIILWIESLLS
jgi:hypothetical protein